MVNGYQQARADLESQVRQQLGEDRYLQYKRGGDPAYHQLNAAVSRYGLPRGKANEAYDVRLSVQQMSAEIQANPGLTQAQKDEAASALQSEGELATRQLVGNPAF